MFNPLLQFDIKPADKVAVIGIGGLGHMALKFLNAWGCEVTAFTSTASKKKEALSLGAHLTLNSRDENEIKSAAGRFDYILSTVVAVVVAASPARHQWHHAKLIEQFSVLMNARPDPDGPSNCMFTLSEEWQLRIWGANR